ncbi:hypothetical protein [Zoogloea sp.]|uniref:hypothetical protein n=1 Tax=Zoogloea sp. TaxID=49181 RepID=UPI00261E0EC8|nr:hypothetical protein [Zoogloea sp.]MDD3352697.1 hypothetical protein [Zoogloea sp.]
MHLIRRSLSLVLAWLVLLWAGAACAEEAYESATELVEQVQVDQLTEYNGVLEHVDPFDSPSFVSRFPMAARLLLDVRPEKPLPKWQSFLPRLHSPPPRRT